MDVASIFGDNSPLAYVMQWMVLTLIFLFLTYLFRNHIEVEGFTGFIIVLFVIIPINIAAKNYLQYMELPFVEKVLPFAYGTLIMVINLVLFLAITFLLPGLSVSSNLVLFVFTLLFSASSILLKFLPTFLMNLFVTVE